MAQAVLSKVARSDGMADDLFESSCKRSGLDARERALALQLTNGVLRYQAALDWRLSQLTKQPFDELPIPVKVPLRLGAYQLLYLDKIPPSAAVDESVKLVRNAQRGSFKGYAGFVNAVLRTLVRQPEPRWPDYQRDIVAALSVRFSCPSWLAARWLARFGLEQAESILAASLATPPLTLRVNTLRTSRDELLADITESGLVVKPTEVSPFGLIVEKCGLVTELPQFREGAFYIEDEGGQLIPPLLNPQPGERVLDACAAPGGKSTHLAALMHNLGEIVAMDRSATRLRLLEENCTRLGATIVTAVQADLAEDPSVAALGSVLSKPYDAILVDAPCTALGVIKRHPEIKWQKTEEDVKRLQSTQLEVLERASALLRPGGRIVYSTCSTEPEENEHVVELFCRNHPELGRESVGRWLPEAGQFLLTDHDGLSTLSTLHSLHSMDAFFACRLRRADHG